MPASCVRVAQLIFVTYRVTVSSIERRVRDIACVLKARVVYSSTAGREGRPGPGARASRAAPRPAPAGRGVQRVLYRLGLPTRQGATVSYIIAYYPYSVVVPYMRHARTSFHSCTDYTNKALNTGQVRPGTHAG